MHLAHFLERLAHDLETANQIFREMFAFPLAHFDQFAERGAQGFLERRPGFVRRKAVIGETQHPGRLQNHSDRDLAGHAQFFLQGAHAFVVGTGQGAVEREIARSAGAAVVGHDDIGASARDTRRSPPGGRAVRSALSSRGRLITMSLCLRFTELISTLIFAPPRSLSPRP